MTNHSLQFLSFLNVTFSNFSSFFFNILFNLSDYLNFIFWNVTLFLYFPFSNFINTCTFNNNFDHVLHFSEIEEISNFITLFITFTKIWKMRQLSSFVFVFFIVPLFQSTPFSRHQVFPLQDGTQLMLHQIEWLPYPYLSPVPQYPYCTPPPSKFPFRNILLWVVAPHITASNKW